MLQQIIYNMRTNEPIRTNNTHSLDGHEEIKFPSRNLKKPNGPMRTRLTCKGCKSQKRKFWWTLIYFFVMVRVCLLFITVFVVFALANRTHYRDVALIEDESWEVLGRVDRSEEISVRFALRQRNLDILEDTLMSVSDPRSPKFHQYWTKEQIMELVSPPLVEQQLVVSWALESGCSYAESFGDFVKVTCPVADLERMLGDVEIVEVRDVRLGESAPKIITGQYSLPHPISRVVEFVQNLAMNVHKRRLSSFRVPSSIPREGARPRYQEPSEDQVIPATLFNLYNISHTISTLSSQSVAEFSNFGYLESDLTAFDNGCGLPKPNPIKAVGSFSPSPPNVECTLDVQMITSVGQNGTNFYYTVDGWVLDFAQELLQSNDPPMVNSISWSSDERTEGYVRFLYSSTLVLIFVM